MFPVWFTGHFSIEWSWNKTGNTLNQKTCYGWYTGSTQFWRDYHLGREQLLPKGCRFRVLTQVKTGILDRSRAASQWKKCCFRIVGRNETTTSLFFGKINKVAHHFFFLFFFLLPPLSFFFQGEEHHTFPHFERSYHWGHLQDIMWQNSIRFNSPPS